MHRMSEKIVKMTPQEGRPPCRPTLAGTARTSSLRQCRTSVEETTALTEQRPPLLPNQIQQLQIVN